MRSLGINSIRLALSKKRVMPQTMKSVEVISISIGSIP